MARKLRIQFKGALYHVLNRGNYRRDIFEAPTTAKAFETTLDEACERYGWRLHAYVVMRNHYHLALETPEPNLVEGMHWLQSTFATRFNRLRSERGHLFQGRYQALLLEDTAALARVVNYLHLNPVRAGIVPVEQVAAFRWSSLARFLKQQRPAWLVATDWLAQLGWDDTRSGLEDYVTMLSDLAGDPDRQERQGLSELSKGWAIGTAGWCRAIAKDHSHLALAQGIAAADLREIKEARWTEVLARVMGDAGKMSVDLRNDPKGADWKILAAERLRREAGASHRWIAKALEMGSPNSVRSYLSRRASGS